MTIKSISTLAGLMLFALIATPKAKASQADVARARAIYASHLDWRSGGEYATDSHYRLYLAIEETEQSFRVGFGVYYRMISERPGRNCIQFSFGGDGDFLASEVVTIINSASVDRFEEALQEAITEYSLAAPEDLPRHPRACAAN